MAHPNHVKRLILSHARKGERGRGLSSFGTYR